MKRQCGDCDLCCRLVPVAEIGKKGNQVCQYQQTKTVLSHGPWPGGCSIYPLRPNGCVHWSCAWLSDPEKTHDLDRPDRTHYCIDPTPDFITVTNDGGKLKIPVMQVWCDPKYPDAHRDPALRALIDKAGEKGFAALVRYDNANGQTAVTLFPPSLTGRAEWIEYKDGMKAAQHSPEEIAAALEEHR